MRSKEVAATLSSRVQVLINPQKRAVYDLHGMEGIRHMEQAAQMEANMSCPECTWLWRVTVPSREHSLVFPG